VIGKLSLGRQWKGPQAPFPLASAEIFPGEDNVDILLMLFKFLSMQCKRTSTKRFTHSTKKNGSILRRPITSLGHQEGRRVFREGPKFLNYTTSNIFELCPTHFSRGGRKFFYGGGFASPAPPPGYGTDFKAIVTKKCTSLAAIARHFEISYTKYTICMLIVHAEYFFTKKQIAVVYKTTITSFVYPAILASII